MWYHASRGTWMLVDRIVTRTLTGMVTRTGDWHFLERFTPVFTRFFTQNSSRIATGFARYWGEMQTFSVANRLSSFAHVQGAKPIQGNLVTT